MAYEDSRWREMGPYISPMCNYCTHYRHNAACDAYPDGIPKDLIIRGEHETPYPGDHGIRFQAEDPEEWEREKGKIF